MSTPRTIAPFLVSVLVALFGAAYELGAEEPVSKQDKPVDRKVWARKLAGLNDAGWRTAFGLGQELAALPGDEGFAILKANWEKVGSVEARQQLLKAWNFALPYPLHLRPHPRLLDVLDLG